MFFIKLPGSVVNVNVEKVKSGAKLPALIG
jgi:hypothetical protein